jgi:hypothetical protein
MTKENYDAVIARYDLSTNATCGDMVEITNAWVNSETFDLHKLTYVFDQIVSSIPGIRIALIPTEKRLSSLSSSIVCRVSRNYPNLPSGTRAG